MASRTSNQSGPISLDINPSPETMYHLPISPNEPGKFDFYRVYLANHGHHSNSTLSESFDAPVLSAPNDNSSTTKPRWTPFANLVGLDSSKSSVSSNTNGQSSLTDAVKSAMKTGQITVPENSIRRPISGATLSSKDLNHLSPQSM